MQQDRAIDLDLYAETMAGALDIPFDAEFAPGITANLGVAFRLAPLFLDFILGDAAEMAPVFDPLEGV